MRLKQSRVVKNRGAGAGYWLLVLDAPSIAQRVQPGQFVHLRVPNLDGCVLRRPFSVFQARAGRISILYKSVGKGTQAMTRLRPGDAVSLVGPLGNGFPVAPNRGFPILVAGGYGVAALYLAAKALPAKGILFVGGAARREIRCVPDFRALGWPVRIATEDGSWGRKGLVTMPLDRWLQKERAGRTPEFYACGPMDMLKAVADRAVKHGWTAWLSLERHMGCGVGACLACVQKVRKPGQNRRQVMWARICRDGPVFESRQVVWD